MDDLVEMEAHDLGSPQPFTYKYTVFILRLRVQKSCKVSIFHPNMADVGGRLMWLP